MIVECEEWRVKCEVMEETAPKRGFFDFMIWRVYNRSAMVTAKTARNA